VLARRHALLYHQLDKGVLPVVNPRPCPNVPNARTAILFFFVQAERSPMMVIRPRTWAGRFKCHATRYIVLVPHTKASPFNDPFIDEGVLLVVNPRSCPDVPNGHPIFPQELRKIRSVGLTLLPQFDNLCCSLVYLGVFPTISPPPNRTSPYVTK